MKLFRPLFIIILALALFVATAHEQDKFRNTHREQNVTAPPLSALRPEMLRIFTLGFKNLYDDFVNLWMTQIFVDSEQLHDHPDDVARVIRQVLRHEPKIEVFYMLACFVSFKDIGYPQLCDEIIETGIRLFPESFRLPMVGGFVWLFELNQPAKAAQYYSIAASRKDAPEYVERVVTKLINRSFKLDRKSLEEILESMHESVSDNEGWQQIFRKKYDELKSGESVQP